MNAPLASHAPHPVRSRRGGIVAKSLRLGVAALALAAAALPSQARAPYGAEQGVENGARHVTMGVGKSVIIDLPQDAAEIFVGNPAVANAVVRTPRKIFLIGTGAGSTTLFALDKGGRPIASYEITIGRDVGELSQILRLALPTANIFVRTVGESLILTGEVASAEDAQRASDMAEGFVKQLNGPGGAGSAGMVVNSLTIRGRDQVMLKVTISEMRRDIAKQLGITSSTWGSLTQYNPFGINGALSANTSGATAFSGPGAVAASNFLSPNNTPLTTTSGLGLSPSNNLNATLQAFERYGVTRTLAEPTVTAVSGENAKFTVGGQFPYSTGYVCTGGACTTGTSFKNYGITLNFEPVVLSEGRILLHLATEVADIDYAHAVVVGGVPTPGIITRQNETTIELPSGGSIASAGLIQQRSQQVINGLPGLLNVPILGTLFRSRDYQRNETELIIIVTPIIVKPVAPNQIARPDDGFTDASDPQTWLLGRMNRLYATPSNPEAAKNFRGRVGFIQD